MWLIVGLHNNFTAIANGKIKDYYLNPKLAYILMFKHLVMNVRIPLFLKKHFFNFQANSNPINYYITTKISEFQFKLLDLFFGAST